ncbi:MAG: tRNA lysidine(34) synthetase TilS [Firmicutes bacterium]|nr:tRNA lysidine(34) synthetase TilS [Bacillota bacterium]
MDILPQVQDTIRRFKMFQPGDVVVVGVSGGPDSVALLDLLWRLREHLPLSLHVAHLNHRFREEAAREAEFVRELAASYGLQVTAEERDVPAYAREYRLSPEVAAREVRYEFFTSVLKQAGAAKVALGHQADDQAETVLLNFLRGTGLTGLKGIPPCGNRSSDRLLKYGAQPSNRIALSAGSKPALTPPTFSLFICGTGYVTNLSLYWNGIITRR